MGSRSGSRLVARPVRALSPGPFGPRLPASPGVRLRLPASPGVRLKGTGGGVRASWGGEGVRLVPCTHWWDAGRALVPLLLVLVSLLAALLLGAVRLWPWEGGVRVAIAPGNCMMHGAARLRALTRWLPDPSELAAFPRPSRWCSFPWSLASSWELSACGVGVGVTEGFQRSGEQMPQTLTSLSALSELSELASSPELVPLGFEASPSAPGC